jgi:hypothetical protein
MNQVHCNGFLIQLLIFPQHPSCQGEIRFPVFFVSLVLFMDRAADLRKVERDVARI